jgi:hypothetical protein
MRGSNGESFPAARTCPGPRGRRPRTLLVMAVAVLAAVGVAGCQGHASSPAAARSAAQAAASGAVQPAAPGGAAQPAAPSGTPLSALAWSAGRAPLPADTDGVSGQYVVLDDVSCPAVGHCVAVGIDRASTGSGDVYQGLAETLAGGTWSPAAIPDVSSPNLPLSLSAVSCPAQGSCVAVGFAESSAKVGVPVMERLSAGRWDPVTPPRPGDASTSGGDLLTDISCPAVNWCVAVGWYLNAGGHHAVYADTLADGTWTAASVPLPPDAAPEQGTDRAVTYLTAVSCTGIGACVASGQYRGTSGGSLPFTATLSNGTWTAAAAPLPGDAAATSQFAGLWALKCPAPGTCVAGGHYLNHSGQARYLIDTLSGGTWTASAAPLPPGAAADQKWSQDQATVIGGLGCASASLCVATADYLTTDNEIVPVIETLSGGTWTAASVPLPADAAPASGQGSYAYLMLATCPAPASCLTVGSYPAQDGTIAGLVETAAPKSS